MGNKKNNKGNRAASNYELKSDAVEELVDANSGEAPEYSKEELNQYRSKSGIHIPEPVKILFIKAWFAGAICFFFIWGLGNYIYSMLDMLFVVAIVLGVATDILVNNVIRFIETTPGDNDKWMMFPKKNMLSFLMNILYSFLIIFCVYMLYFAINYVLTGITGNALDLGVEPILFGVFCMGFDMLFIGIKNLIKKIICDALDKVKPGSRGA